MGYQPRRWAPRKQPRKQRSRRGKIRAKSKRQKRPLSGSYVSEEKQAPTSEEVANKTLSRLNILGSQRYNLPPFNEHLDRWLMALRIVLSEFETSPAVKVDDQFVEECSQILFDVELKLKEIRLKEASVEQATWNISGAKRLLEQIESEYAAKSKETENRRDHEVARSSSKVEAIRKEVDNIARMKTGLFTGISKKAKAQKESEATGRLMSAEKELAATKEYFTIEQKRLRDEYARKRQPILEQIQNHEKKIDNIEAETQTDGSIEARRSGCEAIANAVNTLLRRSAEPD